MEKLNNLEKNDNRFVRLFKKIDFIGEQPQLQIEGEDRHKTIFGSICSLIVLFGTIFTGVFFLGKVIDTKNPEISKNKVRVDQTRLLNLTEHKFYAVFISLSLHIDHTTISRYITPMASIANMKLLTNDEGRITDIKEKRFPLLAQPCTGKEDLFPHVQNLGVVAKEFLARGICFFPQDEENYFLNSTLFAGNPTNLRIEIFPCTLVPATQCADSQALNKIETVFIFPQINLMLEKKDDYKLQVAHSLYGKFSTGLMSIREIYIMQEDLSDENMMFLGDNFRGSTLATEIVENDSQERDKTMISCLPGNLIQTCYPYFIFRFHSATSSMTIKRKYQDIFQAFAEVGGFNEILLLTISAIYFCFAKSSFIRYFIKKSFFDKEGSVREFTKKELDDYEDNANENFDIICIAKQFNALKLINMVHFEEHHLILLPYILKAIKMHEVRIKKQELSLKRSQSEFQSFGLSKQTKTITDMKFNKKTLSKEEAVKKLFSDSVDQPQEDNSSRKKIDELFKFYYNVYSSDIKEESKSYDNSHELSKAQFIRKNDSYEDQPDVIDLDLEGDPVPLERKKSKQILEQTKNIGDNVEGKNNKDETPKFIKVKNKF